jgi:hypothetical protein
MEITSYGRQDQTCESSIMPIQKKKSLDLLFLSSPDSTCNTLSREIEGKTQLVSRCTKDNQVKIKQSNLMPSDYGPYPRHEHLLLLGASVPPHGVTVLLLLDLLPSCGWFLAGFHLLTHPLHHALHPNLTVVLILFHLLWPSKLLRFSL